MKTRYSELSGPGTSYKGTLTNEAGGVALVLVIWVIVVLIAVVGEFSYSMRTEINMTRNFKEDEEAYQLALAGIERAKAEILSVNEPAVASLNKENVLVFGEEQDAPVRKDTLGKGSFEYAIEDEDGKLNINTSSAEQLRQMLVNSGVDDKDVDVIVDSIMDWRDTDDLHMLSGAEEDYYNSLDRPYSSKDGPFDSIEELLLVKGMEPEILYGSKDEESEKTYEGIAKYLTVYNAGMVNINTASREVIEVVFGAAMAENIISQREAGLRSVPVKNGKTASEFFRIVSTGSNSDGSIRRSVRTIVHKKDGKLETLYWNDNFIG